MRAVLVLISSFVINSLASPNGAPATQAVCESMTPNHGVTAQESASPYRLEVSESSIKSGEIIKVQILADEGRDFRGFYLLARTNEPEFQVLGEFLPDEDESEPFNFRDCYEKNHNAVTHFSRDSKTKISFKWKAPENFQGSIHFRATVVEEKTSFWTDHVSENVEIELQETGETVYDGCGVVKSCFGLPIGCLDSKDCVAFGAVIVENGVFEFEMLSANNAAYIALALSDDEFMGGDSAIECVKENGAVKAFTSFTRAIPNNYGARRSEIDQSIIELKESRLENGAIYCKVARQLNTIVDEKPFDLTSQEFYLLMASGETSSDTSIGFHSLIKDASSSAILFTEDNPIIILPSPQTTVKPGDDNGVYDDCGKTKSCIGLPDGCINNQNCAVFGAVIVKNGVYEFEMMTPNKAAYVATAISDDGFMGQDSVIECVNENNEIKHYTSVTRAIPNNYGARRNDNQDIIRLKEGRIDDGVIYCRVERDPLTTVDDMTFNLVNKSYFLLIASGSTQSELSVGYHGSSRGVSQKAILFTETAVDIDLASPSVSRTLLLIHASFMIVSWIGATSIGVFSARYFKTIWKGTKMFGKDAWFIVHQIAMSLTWILTVAAVIIIWIDVGEWRTSTHSVLGIIATSLCFIQPITAFFRPAPTDAARPIFNFMHGSVGKLAHFLAVITIFFATSMTRAELPSWMKYVLIAYVVVYFVFYALFMNLGIISDIKQKQLSEKEVEQQARSSPPLTTVRRILFILFSILILGFVITLINAIAL